MESGFTDFPMTNHSSHLRVKWARYGEIAGIERQQKMLDEIERMLNEDIPVVFSYHTFTKGDDIIMYDSLENAKKGMKTGTA